MARPKSTGETKTHQQHLLMAPSEVKAIDDWMFANRIRSRGEAIRRLCRIGIASDRELPTIHQGLMAGLQNLGRILEVYRTFMEKEDRQNVRDEATHHLVETAEEVVLLLDDAGVHSIQLLAELDPLRSTSDLSEAMAQSEEIYKTFTALLEKASQVSEK